LSGLGKTRKKLNRHWTPVKRPSGGQICRKKKNFKMKEKKTLPGLYGTTSRVQRKKRESFGKRGGGEKNWDGMGKYCEYPSQYRTRPDKHRKQEGARGEQLSRRVSKPKGSSEVLGGNGGVRSRPGRYRLERRGTHKSWKENR